MPIRIGQRQFAPSLFMTLLTLLGIVLFSGLGMWQLERAEVKRKIEQRFTAQLEQPYRYILLEEQQDENLQYQKIRLRGRFDNDHLILVDNRLNNGVAGYHVLQPFFASGESMALLVNRGWVAADPDRSRFPDILPPRLADEIYGILTIPSMEGYRLGEVQMTGSWPQRIPFVDLERIAQGLDFKIYPYLLWQAAGIDDYYVRDWRPVWSPPEKSEAYAVQWFSFGIVALLLYLILNLKPVVKEGGDE